MSILGTAQIFVEWIVLLGGENVVIDNSRINEAKAKIGDRTADLIAEILEVENYDEHNKKGCCPFHHEKTPSFIFNPKTYKYHCFGCNKNVDIVDAFIEGQHLTFNEAVSKVFELADMDIPMPEVGLKSNKNYRYPSLTNADKTPVYEYLAKRGISKEIVDYAGLSCDGKGNIEFPFYDSNDVIKTVKLRPARRVDKTKGEIKTWVQKDTDHENVLFLQNLANPEFPLLITEGECFKGDTEILTPNGWVRLDRYNGEKVLQINDNGSGSFVTPNAYISKPYNGDMWSVESGGNYHIETTPNHNMVYKWGYSNHFYKCKMCEMPKTVGSIPISTLVEGEGIPLTNNQIALYLAVSADCTIDVRKTTRHCRFSVKKDRKYNRMKKILDELGIEYFTNINQVSKVGYKYIGFTTPDWIKSKMLPQEWIGLATIAQRRFILNEMVHWDGNHVPNRNMFEYSSKEYENVTFMQAIAHTCGYSSNICKRHNSHGEWYKASILFGKDHVSWQGVTPNKTKYQGTVYCVSVDSGMILVRSKGKISVCGNCDALAAIQAGYKNTVSIPFGCGNTRFIDEQWDFLEQFDTIVVAGDNDEAGRKFSKEVVARLGNWRTRAVQLPTSYTKPDGTKIAISDVNEVLYYYGAEKVLKCINEAINKPIPTVIDFSDTKDFDISELDGVNFGLKEVDQTLMKIFNGSLTVLFAKAASGKTSLTNALISNAVDDGKSVFLYSQELANNLTANWIMYSLAGRRNINSYVSKEGSTYYKVTPNARKKIMDYYRNQLYIYRDGESIDIDDILKTAELCVRRQGVSLVILDNLTCISCKGCESDLMRQTEITRKCVKFAITYNCAVVLCCHSRKTNEGLSMDDLMGSSNTANLAGRVLALERDETGVTLKVSKDRFLGKNGTNIRLAFDYPSRRFFSPSNPEVELNRIFKWDNGECIAQNPPKSIALDQVKQKQYEEQEVFGGVSNSV